MSGVYCEYCKQVVYEEKIVKFKKHQEQRIRRTPEYGISRVKSVADPRFWCTSHTDCFRATISVNERGEWKGETEAHVRKKFERWLYHRSKGRSVWCELILKNGMGRPDLVINDNGFVFIEEIVCSEKKVSIIMKGEKYPFPIQVIKTEV